MLCGKIKLGAPYAQKSERLLCIGPIFLSLSHYQPIKGATMPP